MESFAVLWSDSSRPPRPGRLELDESGLRFEGPWSERRVPYEDIESVHVARTRRERLRGRAALVLDLAVGGTVRIGSLDGVGILAELAERLGRVTATPLRS